MHVHVRGQVCACLVYMKVCKYDVYFLMKTGR